MMTLREARESKNMSKTDMCRELCVSRPTYNAYESDPYRTMAIEQFRNACKAIGVDTSEIFLTRAESKIY